MHSSNIQPSDPPAACAALSIATIRCDIELAIHLPSAKPQLDKVLDLLATHAVQVLTYSSYHEHDRQVLLVITDAAPRAQSVLRHAGYQCRADEVVLVGLASYRPGLVARLGWQLRHTGIDILYSYLSAAGADGQYAVFKTSDNHQALHVLARAELPPND